MDDVINYSDKIKKEILCDDDDFCLNDKEHEILDTDNEDRTIIKSDVFGNESIKNDIENNSNDGKKTFVSIEKTKNVCDVKQEDISMFQRDIKEDIKQVLPYKDINNVSNPQMNNCNVNESFMGHNDFQGRCDLKKHLMNKSIGKPLKCDLCQTGYRYMIDLKRHLMNHSREMLYLRSCIRVIVRGLLKRRSTYSENLNGKRFSGL